MNAARILAVSALLFLFGCTPEYSPKPKAYPRMVFPQKQYQLFAPENCPYSFEVPVYAEAIKDTMYQGRLISEKCWYNLQFPELNATINLTYKEITPEVKMEKLVDDAYRLSFKHAKKADYIDEKTIQNPQGLGGVVYEVGGNAASSIQFFLTDSNRHFVRGALYFNSEPNIDSMRPAIAFMRKDLDHMIRTFKMQ